MPSLEIIKDMPRGKAVRYSEEKDMAREKEVFGDNASIAENLPISVLCTGMPQEVKEGCRRLIETCASGGGYILTASAGMNQGNPDNLLALGDTLAQVLSDVDSAASSATPRLVQSLHRPLSGSGQTARGLSLSDGADSQEVSRVLLGSGGDHEAGAPLWPCLTRS